MISYLVLSSNPGIIIGGGLIGLGYSIVYLAALKNFISSTAKVDKYVDSEFKL